MKIKITVTKSDIKKSAECFKSAKPSTPSVTCPVYQAFKRKGFNVKSVCRHFGYGYYVMLKHNKSVKDFNLPAVANQFIFGYDNSSSFLRHKPFSFTIDIPKQYLPKIKTA